MAGVNARLGAIGEAFFEQLCHEGNITPNKVQFDDKGWDFFVQLPQSSANCLVQVKTTRNSQRVPVKLANWRRLVLCPLPAFFFVVVTNKARKPVGGYLLHVDESMERDVYSRPGDGTLDLRWSEDHALGELAGASLRTSIESAVASDFLVYAEKKANRLQSYRSETVTITMPDLPEDELSVLLADFAVGITQSLKVKRIESVPNEFGKAGAPKRFDEPSVQITPPSCGTTSVTLRNIDKGELITLEMESYYSERMFRLPRRFQKTRFVAGPLAVVVSTTDTGDTRISWSFNLPDSMLRLADVVRPATAMRMLLDHAEREHLRLSFEQAWLDKSAKASFPLPMPIESEDVGEGVVRMVQAIEQAWRLCSEFGLPPDVAVSREHLRREADRLQLLHLPFLHHGDLEMRVDTAFKTADEVPPRAALLLDRAARIGDFVLAAAIAFEGVPTLDVVGETRWLVLRRPVARLVKKAAVPIGEWKEFDFGRLHVDATQSLKENGIDCVLQERRDSRRNSVAGSGGASANDRS